MKTTNNTPYADSRVFGIMPSGEKIYEYTISNKNLMTLKAINFGAALTQLHVKDRLGTFDDVLVGYSDLQAYSEKNIYTGCVTGRNTSAISKAKFSIDGIEYSLDENKGKHNFNGGSNGLSTKVFDARIIKNHEGRAIEMKCTLQHKSDGFPGSLQVKITYTLTDNNQLFIDYEAVGDKKTVINLSNFVCFNLGGQTGGTIYNHSLQLNAPFYIPITSDKVPTGEILSVKNTPLDFTKSKMLKQGINSSDEQVAINRGFDNTFVLSSSGYRLIGKMYHEKTGRIMTIYTDRPAIHLDTCNTLLENYNKAGEPCGIHQAVCLAPQALPNAVNIPWFPSIVFDENSVFKSRTGYYFFTDR